MIPDEDNKAREADILKKTSDIPQAMIMVLTLVLTLTNFRIRIIGSTYGELTCHRHPIQLLVWVET